MGGRGEEGALSTLQHNLYPEDSPALVALCPALGVNPGVLPLCGRESSNS